LLKGFINVLVLTILKPIVHSLSLKLSSWFSVLLSLIVGLYIKWMLIMHLLMVVSQRIFMSQPLGFVNSHFPDYVCKLHKALYSLKQAPRAWYNALKGFLITYQFLNSRSDTPLFEYNWDGVVAYFIVYVDDLLLMGNNDSFMNAFKTAPYIEVLFKGSRVSSPFPWCGNPPYVSRFVSFTTTLCTWVIDLYQHARCKTCLHPSFYFMWFDSNVWCSLMWYLGVLSYYWFLTIFVSHPPRCFFLNQ